MLFHPSFTQLINVFAQDIKWTDEEILGFTNQLTISKHKKSTYLLQTGDICDKLWFFNKGFCRVVCKKEVEKTIYFIQENNFVTDIGGLLFRIPSHHYIELMENSEVVAIPKTALEWAQENMGEGNKLIRILHERKTVSKMERIYDTYFPGTIERYEKMLLEFPLIEQRVSQKIIASYLNISAVHLSRLKAKRKSQGKTVDVKNEK